MRTTWCTLKSGLAMARRRSAQDGREESKNGYKLHTGHHLLLHVRNSYTGISYILAGPRYHPESYKLGRGGEGGGSVLN